MSGIQSSEASAAMPTGSETYSSAMADATNYISWLLGAFGENLRAPILEIGVGHGSYAHLLRERGPYMGVDIDDDSVSLARQRFPDLRFEQADITTSEFVERFSSEGIRTVVCLNVVEHIPDHQTAVSNLARILAPGGRLLLIVPALPALFNDLDRLAGHLRRYRRRDVRGLLTAAGLHAERVDYFNPVGGAGWWVNRLMTHRSLNDTAVNAQIALFDKWAIPLSRSVDPLTRRFFGQSVIAIGCKQ